MKRLNPTGQQHDGPVELPSNQQARKAGFRKDLGIYVRSSWEANYARYLNWLGMIWQYEPYEFWFHKIKRGCRSYKPDFMILLPNGDQEWHEVKGWMNPRSKTALKRMRIYYPEVKMVLIDSQRYREIAKQMKGIIKNWE